jgi:hypothetical protein
MPELPPQVRQQQGQVDLGLWAKLRPFEFGLPEIDPAWCFAPEGRVGAWLPGMSVDCNDWNAIIYDISDFRNYAKQGGDWSKVIVHWMTYDTGKLDPLWGNLFMDRVEKMRSLGVKYCVAPDFSAWGDFPIAVQVFNHYKSLVVARDLTFAGFKVIPNVAVGAMQLWPLMVMSWPKAAPAIMLDMTHGSGGYDRSAFGHADLIAESGSERVLIWANDRPVADGWKRVLKGKRVDWVPSRVRALRDLVKHKRRCFQRNKENRKEVK